MALPIVSRKIHGPVDYILPHVLAGRLGAGESVMLLDIRSPKEFEQSHINGAINVSGKELEAQLASGGKELEMQSDRPIVLICQSDSRTIVLFKKFRDAGFTNVQVMKGGMFKWKRDLLPLNSA
jgi:rhodanese-related sulfurtransferase